MLVEVHAGKSKNKEKAKVRGEGEGRTMAEKGGRRTVVALSIISLIFPKFSCFLGAGFCIFNFATRKISIFKILKASMEAN